MAHPPLTPPECDLQDFPFMPLHVARLRDSDLAAEEAPEACWYAVLLWAAAWHQIPAGSLPDNDAVLTKLIGLGRDVKTFRKHKVGAMRGFVLCDDGRLYHPIVAEQALTAWQSKLQQRWRTECARVKKANQRNGTDDAAPTFEEFMSLEKTEGQTVVVPRDNGECPQGQGVQGTGTGTGNIEEDPPNPPEGDFRDPIFIEAVQAYPEAGRLTVSLEAMGEAWDGEIDTGATPAAILAAAKAFAAGQYADSGGKVPRFDRWLRKGLWKLVSPAAPPVTPLAWNGPPDLLADLRREMGEADANGVLRMCRWDQDRSAIVTSSGTVADLIRKGGPRTLRTHQIQVLEERAA